MLVTLAGHDIFKGRALLMPSTPADYSNFIVACLTHDIGYVRGVCRGDVALIRLINDEADRDISPRSAPFDFGSAVLNGSPGNQRNRVAASQMEASDCRLPTALRYGMLSRNALSSLLSPDRHEDAQRLHLAVGAAGMARPFRAIHVDVAQSCFRKPLPNIISFEAQP